MLLLPLTPSSRMHFRARLTSFVGREHELERLRVFIESVEPFQWWIVTGAGGMGKSRLALEVCLRHRSAWEVGFLPEKSTYDRWSEWVVKKPTLIVADYASMRPLQLQTMVEALAARADSLENRVRVLIVERSIEGEWWEQFLGTGTIRLLLKSASPAAPLALGEMSQDELWASMQEYLCRSEMIEVPDRQETLSALARLDPLHRPLFAVLAADALIARQDISTWDQATLLRDILRREEARFWQPAGVTARDKHLLCLSTIVGGMSVELLQWPVLQEGCELPSVVSGDPMRFNSDRYEAMVGSASTDTLAPLKPDLIGEFFVLEHLIPTDSADESRALKMVVMGWIIGAVGGDTLEFANRIFNDFPDHNSAKWFRWSLSNSGIEMMLDLTKSNPESKDKLLWRLVPAKANLIRALSGQDKLSEARRHFDELVQLSDRFPTNDILEPVLMASACSLAGALVSKCDMMEMRALLEYVADRWRTRGNYKDIEIFVRCCFAEANGAAERNESSNSLLLTREVVRLVQHLADPTTVCGLLAGEIGRLVRTLASKGAIAEAMSTFQLLLGLKVPSEEQKALATGTGMAGLAIVSAWMQSQNDVNGVQMEQLAAVIEGTRSAVLSNGFGEGLLEPNVIEAATRTVAWLDSIIGSQGS
jgi:hypothetical protein